MNPSGAPTNNNSSSAAAHPLDRDKPDKGFSAPWVAKSAKNRGRSFGPKLRTVAGDGPRVRIFESKLMFATLSAPHVGSVSHGHLVQLSRAHCTLVPPWICFPMAPCPALPRTLITPTKWICLSMTPCCALSRTLLTQHATDLIAIVTMHHCCNVMCRS